MYAFRYSGLQSVTIPSTVTSIGRYAFYCQNLTTATLLPATPPQSDYVVFNPNTIQTVYVPEASLDAYRNTEPWSWLGYDRFMAIVVRDQSTTEGVGEEDWN